MSVRYDFFHLDKFDRTPQGGLRVDAVLTRTGVFVYRNADGSVRRELRHPDHVFEADSMTSLEDATLTHLHPAKVSPDNYKAVSIGHVKSVKRDGKNVAAVAIIQDKKAIEGVARGDLAEVSCGYNCDLLNTPGEYEGEKYDCIQTNIVYNHVSLGPKDWGRGGNSVRLRLDSHCAIQDGIQTAIEDERTDTVEQETINGVKFDVGSPQHVQALKVRADAESKRADDAQAALSAEKGRADGLSAELKSANEALAKANDPARIADAVKSRVAMEGKAANIVGKSEAKFDGLTDQEVMVKAITKKDPSFKLDASMDAGYLRGRFDALASVAPQSTTQVIQAGINQALTESARKDENGAEAPKPQPNMSERYFNQSFPATAKK